MVSKSRLSKRELLFFDVAADSIRKIISKKFIGELIIMSNGDFYYFKDKLKQKGKRAEFKNVSEFIGFEVEKGQAKKEVESIEVEIKGIEENERLEIERFSTEKRVLDAKKAELRKIEGGFSSYSDYEKGKAIIKKKALVQEISKINIKSPSLEVFRLKKQLLKEKIKSLNVSQKFSGKIIFYTVVQSPSFP